MRIICFNNSNEPVMVLGDRKDYKSFASFYPAIGRKK
jgi:hypothetical protein